MVSPAGLAAFLAILFAGLSTCNATNSCCNNLKLATSSDKVLDSSSADYSSESLEYWSSTCFLSPQCIFTPTSSSDVSIAMKVLTRDGCQFAVRGGGHTPNAGWAGTSSGVLISLSRLNRIRMSPDSESIVVGAGNRWGDVYAETGKYNLTVAGGRVSPVGVSGLLLGGGLSFLMHQVGFAANSVLQYEIVLANGTVARVDDSSRPDLFKALKGGSGNFGIVTNFRLKTYPINYVYAGSLSYSPDRYNILFPLMETYNRNGTESDPKSHFIFAFVNVPALPQTPNMATFYPFYADPVTAPPPVIKPFVDVPTMASTLSIKTVKNVTDEFGTGIGQGQRWGFSAYSVRTDARLFKELYDLWQAATSTMRSIPGWSSGIVFQPISNSMIRESNKRGGNVLGLEPNKDPLMSVNYQYTWFNATDDKMVYVTIRKLIADSKKLARSRGKLGDYIYMNYGSADQSVIASYGQQQVEFLRRVEAKYDPNNVFRKLSPGGFKIPV